MAITYDQFMNYLFAKATMPGIPLSGTFELTARCNLDCRMCYIHRRQFDAEAITREQDTAWWLALAESAQRAGMLTLLLTGGEPLLRPDFQEIFLRCQQLGLLVSVNTNATLIGEEYVRFFTDHPPQRLNITLYGASRDTYAALCGQAEAYDRAVGAILALKAAGVSVKLNFSNTPYNRLDAPAVYQFARDHELPLQTASYMFPPVRACENGSYVVERMTPQQAAEEQLMWRCFQHGSEVMCERIRQFRSGHPMPAPPEECQEMPAEKLRCRAGATTFWITWDGQMRPCGMMTEPSVPVGESFAAVWQTIRQLREQVLLPAKCMQCELRQLCDACAAVTYAETGKFDGVPSYVCEKTQHYWKLCEMFFKEQETKRGE